MQQLSQRVVEIAKVLFAAAPLRCASADARTPPAVQGGLQRRGLNEAPFLRNLEVVAESGKTAADLMLEAYDTRWGKSVDPAFEEYIF